MLLIITILALSLSSDVGRSAIASHIAEIKAYIPVLAQVRVWDSYAGPTYEAAEAAGGLIGESKVIRVITGSEDAGPAPLTGIRSFKLHTP